MHTNSYDEAIGLPTEEAATIALRTQQIIAEETGVPFSVDPLAGSYLVEEMTSRIVSQARKKIEEIDSNGGALTCVKAGLQQRIIHESAWKNLNSIESGETGVVGVNIHIDDEELHHSVTVWFPWFRRTFAHFSPCLYINATTELRFLD